MSKSKSTSVRTAILVLFFIYLGCVGFLYYGNISTTTTMPESLFGFQMDKVAHFLMFLPYPFLAHGSFKGKRKWRNLVFVIISGIALAFIFELTQERIASYRTTDPWDLVANIASLTVSSFFVAIIDLFRK